MFSPQSATKGRGGTPLTARRLRVMRSRGTLALAPYPEIPCRRSSLTASLTDSTSGPATSTRSPSYDSGRDGIHVMKLRNKNVMRPQIIELCGQRADDDPFVDKVGSTHANACSLWCRSADKCGFGSEPSNAGSKTLHGPAWHQISPFAERTGALELRFVVLI